MENTINKVSRYWITLSTRKTAKYNVRFVIHCGIVHNVCKVKQCGIDGKSTLPFPTLNIALKSAIACAVCALLALCALCLVPCLLCVPYTYSAIPCFVCLTPIPHCLAQFVPCLHCLALPYLTINSAGSTHWPRLTPPCLIIEVSYRQPFILPFCCRTIDKRFTDC